jgi:CARDB protein
VDRQTLMARRAIAVVAGVVVLILLVLGIRGCLSARKERAFKDYVRDSAALVQESRQQSDELFGLLRNPGDQTPVDLQNSVNGLRVQAEKLVDRAKGIDHPDQVNGAQRYLVETLDFRRDGFGAIADALPTALGDTGRSAATARIAAQMQNFLASDVIYTQRFVPNLQDALKREHLLDDVPLPDEIARPKAGFLPDIDWLRPTTVADRIARIRGGGGGGGTAATPGLHGTGLGTVTVKPSGKTLTRGQAVDIPVSDNLAFEVQIQNQGENDERDVSVKVSVTGAGKPISVEQRLDTIAAGASKTVTIPLATKVPTGKAVTIKVEISPVSGEKKTDNNKASFPAIFTR